MTINLTPIMRKIKENKCKFVIVGSVCLVIALGVVIASIDINALITFVGSSERIIEGADFSKIKNVAETVIEGARFK